MNHIDIYEGRIERIKDHFRRNRNKYLAGAALATTAGLGYAATRKFNAGSAAGAIGLNLGSSTGNAATTPAPKFQSSTQTPVKSSLKKQTISPRVAANLENEKKVKAVLAGTSDAPF